MSPSDYFDSSALAKRYATEIGSPWVRACCADPGRIITVVNLGELEVSAALAGKLRGGLITQHEYHQSRTLLSTHFQSQYLVLPVTAQHIRVAVDLTSRHRLRGYDAMHLAAALLVNQTLLRQQLAPLTFIAADNDLLLAASAEGLATDNPNLYP